jgi:hypothetical protein
VTEFGYEPKRRKSLSDLFGGSSALRTITNRLSIGRSSLVQGIPPQLKLSHENQGGTRHEGVYASDWTSRAQENYWLNHIQGNDWPTQIQDIQSTPTRIPIQAPQIRPTRFMGNIVEGIEVLSERTETRPSSKLHQETEFPSNIVKARGLVKQDLSIAVPSTWYRLQIAVCATNT